VGKHYKKTTVSVLQDTQLLLNKQQQIWGGIYIQCHIRNYQYSSPADITYKLQCMYLYITKYFLTGQELHIQELKHITRLNLHNAVRQRKIFSIDEYSF